MGCMQVHRIQHGTAPSTAQATACVDRAPWCLCCRLRRSAPASTARLQLYMRAVECARSLMGQAERITHPPHRARSLFRHLPASAPRSPTFLMCLT